MKLFYKKFFYCINIIQNKKIPMLGSIILDKGFYLTLYPTIILSNMNRNINYVVVNNNNESLEFKNLNKITIAYDPSITADLYVDKDIKYFNVSDFIDVLNNLDDYKNKYVAIKLKDYEHGTIYEYLDFNVRIRITQTHILNSNISGINAGILGDIENWRRVPIIEEQYIPTNTIIEVPFYIYIRLKTMITDLYVVELYDNLEYAYKQYLFEKFGIEL